MAAGGGVPRHGALSVTRPKATSKPRTDTDGYIHDMMAKSRLRVVAF